MVKKHEDIIAQVPPNYYQKGTASNMLQKLWHGRKLKAVLSYIEDQPRIVLDIGCASGWFTNQVSEQFNSARYFGVDTYKEAIKYGKRLYPHISFEVAKAEALPFRDDTFDLVFCTETLEHVANPKKSLSEIHRVLKKRGRAIVELDSGSILFSIVWCLWKKSVGNVWNDSHLHSFSAKKLERYITQAGFLIEKKSKFNLGMGMIFLVKKK